MDNLDIIKMLCKEMNISISELGRKLGHSPQNLSKKIHRGSMRLDDFQEIADVLNIKFEVKFILPENIEIKINNFE